MPNQPKTPNRTLRFGDPEWEGFGVFSEARGSDRTKILALFIDACLGRPVQLPAPLPPAHFAALLKTAASETEKALQAETNDSRREVLDRKHKALQALATEAAERASQQLS
ncbi:hypothetical protein FHR32_000322 [Streptosporangium album]|uniref:Uncharacterized protein n=1 Tax=Streptosporangium album TaxID=47479 RepID=A0A7W7RPW7_9ACTN|nr:hypothetical protein [Streptosporangium album]MBB4936017.1 hypothetical protein [Streptosporangium album]